MYTVRDFAEKDWAGTLKQVADIGYTALEFAGTWGVSADDLKKALDDLSLRAISMHVGYPDLTDPAKLDERIAYAKTIGATNFAFSGNNETADAWKEWGVNLAKAGERAGQDGMTVSFHNHSAEFAEFDGTPGLEIMFAAAGLDLLKSQTDVYWVKHAGHDPAEFIRKHAGACPTIHAKDMEADDEKFFAEVGEGILDWPSIFDACESVGGTQWYIVEQDACRRPSIESARLSYENLKKMGKI
jgi:sugar phosphate isomerase/epimerase